MHLMHCYKCSHEFIGCKDDKCTACGARDFCAPKASPPPVKAIVEQIFTDIAAKAQMN